MTTMIQGCQLALLARVGGMPVIHTFVPRVPLATRLQQQQQPNGGRLSAVYLTGQQWTGNLCKVCTDADENC